MSKVEKNVDFGVDEDLIDAVSCDNESMTRQRTDSMQSLDEFEPYIRSRSASDKSSLSEKRRLTQDEVQDLRLKINSRERRRMHDLNRAMESLRQVIPYGGTPSSRKLSKIGTLMLARNYIVMLTKSLEELRGAIATAAVQQSPILKGSHCSAFSALPSSVTTSAPLFPVQPWSPLFFTPSPATSLWPTMRMPSLPSTTTRNGAASS
ncbi:unnamed protein product [Soboliphyme baturini]|uniref:BHLH domain-containing protein n=1 Tax=Soboliphyme baturini TaxID=241478 RepID=A0A183J4B4_9BILA|nr:unnamed protein product [Soboliphyme baturini]